MLTKNEQRILLNVARNSINSLFSSVDIPTPDRESNKGLAQESGAFVTLRLDGDLRGCIGYLYSETPLDVTIANVAKAAAKDDPRFEPVNSVEMEFIKLEISVLSDFKKISSYEEIEIGKHGLLLEEHNGRGLLLPQVATENDMNKEEFLTAICRKSGLNGNKWREKQLNLKVFEAEVFSEIDEL